MKRTGLILALWIFGHFPALAQDVALSVGEMLTQPGDTAAVAVAIENRVAVSGVAFDLGFDAAALSFAGVEVPADPFEVYAQAGSNGVRLVFLDPEAARKLEAGEHTLIFCRLRVLSEGIHPLTLSNITATDGGLPPKRLGSAGAGAAIIATSNAIYPSLMQWVSHDSLHVTLSLRNDQAASALQLRLQLPGQASAYQPVGRATGWSAFAGDDGADDVQVVLADFSGANPIATGDGAILQIQIAWKEDASTEVGIVEALVTDAAGNRIPVMDFPGSVDMAGRPEPVEEEPSQVADPAFETPEDTPEEGVADGAFIEAPEIAGDDPIADSGSEVEESSEQAEAEEGAGEMPEEMPETDVSTGSEAQINEVNNILYLSDAQWISYDSLFVELALNNLQAISGVQLVLPSSLVAVGVSGIGRANAWTSFVGKDANGVRVVAADFSGANPVPPGDGVILRLKINWPTTRLERSVSLGGADVLATDTAGNAVPVAISQEGVALPDRPKRVLSVRIVEILADPPAGIAGDANGDGVRHGTQDEFVELLNESHAPVDISQWFLGDDDVDTTRMFRFPPGTVLQPGERTVLFGGGQPQGDLGRFFVDDGTIGNGLTNAGDVILLLAPGGVDTMDMAVFPQASGQSLVREGDRWTLHKDGVRNAAFSPGKPRPFIEFPFPQPARVQVEEGKPLAFKAFAYYSDGVQVEIPGSEPLWVARDTAVVRISPGGMLLGRTPGKTDAWFAFRGKESLHAEIEVVTGQPAVPQSDGPVASNWALPGGLVISEIFPDPGTGDDGDANGDGVRHTYEDEFVELANLSDAAIDLSGWYLGDDDVAANRMFRFPEGTVLQPGEYATLFGGGTPVGIPGWVFTDDGRIGDGLANAGDVIRLIAPDGQTVVRETAFEQGKRAVSWARNESGEFLLHNELPGTGNFSPGRAQARLSKVRLEPEEIHLFAGESVVLTGWGMFDSGDSLALGDGILWRVSDPEVVLAQNGQVTGLAEGISRINAVWHNVLSNEVRVAVAPRITPDADSSRTVSEEADTLRIAENAIDSTQIAQDEVPVWRLDGLVVSEIHAAPGLGLSGDANGDGVRHTYEDEFVELFNAGSNSLDLSGWRLGDDDVPFDRMFRFPEGTVLQPGAYATLFGGGVPTGIPGLVFTDDGRIGDGLSNSGDGVYLVSSDGQTTAFQMAFPASKDGISYVRDETGAWRLHNELPGKDNLSPGRGQPVLTDLALVPDVWTISVEKEIAFEVLAVFSDGERLPLAGGYSWNMLSDSLISVSKDRVRGLRSGQGVAQVVWGDITSNVVDVRVAEAQIAKHPPVFLSVPDTVAVIGLQYHYRPEVRDADELSVRGLPDWLSWEHGEIAGLPEREGQTVFEVVASSEGGTNVQRVPVRIQAPQNLVASLDIAPAHSGLTWRQKIAVPPGVQVQVDGGPEWHPETQELVWKPAIAQRGLREVTIGFSSRGRETVFVTLEIDMKPAPQLALVEVLQSPMDDANGDGRIDPYEDQFVSIENVSSEAIDLSGWFLGDDDRIPAPLPGGTLLQPGDRLTLFGLCEEAPPLHLSAGGRIGNGLARSDRILLIAPAGPDTLIDERFQADQPGMRLVKNGLGKWEYRTRAGEVQAGILEEAAPEIGAETPVKLDRWLKPVPNPFHAQTTVGFYSAGGQVRVTVYSILGQPVRRLVHRQLPVGYYQRIWDGTNDDGRVLGSGIYLMRLENEQAAYTHRVALLR